MQTLHRAVFGAVGFLLLAGGANANLISNADFTGVNLVYTPFVVNDAGTYNIWRTSGVTSVPGSGKWEVVNDGYGKDGAGDYWAKHNTTSVPIFQGFTAPGSGLFELSFDFIYERGAGGNTNPEAFVYIFGMQAGQYFDKFNVSPGSGQGTVLYSQRIAGPAANAIVEDWTTLSAQFSVTDPLGDPYEAWNFVVWSNAFSSDNPVALLRGIDNASLEAVPEPTTLVLFGTGLLGLFTNLRKRKR